MDENNYADLKEEVTKYDPTIGSHLSENYDSKQIQKYLNTADSLSKQLEEERKRRTEKEEVTTSFPHGHQAMAFKLLKAALLI